VLYSNKQRHKKEKNLFLEEEMNKVVNIDKRMEEKDR
jgi:hypothetical protein